MRGWSEEDTMGKEIRSFRDLEIWQRGIMLVKDVYKETSLIRIDSPIPNP